MSPPTAGAREAVSCDRNGIDPIAIDDAIAIAIDPKRIGAQQRLARIGKTITVVIFVRDIMVMVMVMVVIFVIIIIIVIIAIIIIVL